MLRTALDGNTGAWSMVGNVSNSFRDIKKKADRMKAIVAIP